MQILSFVISSLVGYLLGSLSFAIIVSYILTKKDIRQFDSGNAGMTNVLRNFGVFPAALTAIGDFGKGVVSVIIGYNIGLNICDFNMAVICAYAAGSFAILGHIYPLYFKFRGGKAVLTAAGVISIIDIKTLLVLFVIFIIVVAISKYMSLGSVSVAVLYPVVTCGMRLYYNQPALGATIMSAFIGGIVVFMHRSNIKRLVKGEERKVGVKK